MRGIFKCVSCTKQKEDYSTVKCTLRHLKRTINKYVRSIGDPGSIVINTLVLSAGKMSWLTTNYKLGVRPSYLNEKVTESRLILALSHTQISLCFTLATGDIGTR